MLRAVAWIFVCLLPVWAQSTATLRGTVLDAQGAPVPDAAVRLVNALTGFERDVRTQQDGTFQITNIPLQTYAVSAAKQGFDEWRDPSIVLRSNVPVELTIRLAVAGQATRVEVSAAELVQLVDIESTGTRTELNASTMNRMPVPPTTRGLEAMLMSMPGFAANANGAIHPRGAHNQMTYVVDGMPISDQLTGAFANAVDPSIVQTIELFTGNVPVEFGSKVSGVAVITTRSGVGSGRLFGGSTQLIAAQYDTLGQVTQFSGGNDKWGYFASLNAMKSNRYLDQVSVDNLHNGGNSQRAFGRFDYTASPRNQLRFSAMAGRSSFQLTNLRSQHANRQDQRQLMEDSSMSLGWLRTVNAQTTVDTILSWRTANAKLFPSPGDTPVTASQDRRLSTFTVGSRWNRVEGRHIWRVGFDIQRFPVREQFSFGITDANFEGPERMRRGDMLRFSDQATGGLYSGFAQDSVRLGRLVLTLGLRYDNYRFLVTGVQWQPRLGFAYHIRETGTVLRGSYNRTYQTPPNENLLLSNSRVIAALAPDAVREALGGAVISIRPERQNVLEAGVQQAAGKHVSLTGTFFHKNSRNLQDNDNFMNTGIIFPITLAGSRTNGLEGRMTLVPVRGFSGSLSVTHMHTVAMPPFTGGLFLGSSVLDSLNAGPFIIDHDQPLSVHGLVQYNIRRNLWVSSATRYDSGLVANPSDPADVASDPDYFDLLPYVKLLAAPARVRGRTISDLAVGYERTRGERRLWDATFQISNIANRTALYNFQSIFVGTRLVQPRTASIKLRFWF